MRRKTAAGVYTKFIVLLLSFGLFSCSSLEHSNGEDESGFSNFAKLFDEAAVVKEESKSAAEALAGAAKAEQKGDLDQALYYYIQSLKFAPENAAVFLKIAQIHELRGNTSIAIRAYSQAVKNDPALLLAYQGLGIIYLEKRKYKQAQTNLEKAVLLDQQRLSKQGGEKSGAYYLLDKQSPIKSYNVLGIIEDMQSHFGLARTYYNLALSMDERSANLLSNIGYSYYLTGELNLAERYFKRAINADRQFKRAWSNLGLIYVRKGQYNRAVKTLKQVMEEFEAYNDLGYFLMLDGHLEEAEYYFQKAIDMSPRYFERAYSNLEQVQLKLHDLSLENNEAQEEQPSTPQIDFNNTRLGLTDDQVLKSSDLTES
jgi:Flp pilus assembly protein TadD